MGRNSYATAYYPYKMATTIADRMKSLSPMWAIYENYFLGYCDVKSKF